MATSLSLKFELASGDTRTMSLSNVIDTITSGTTDEAVELINTAANTIISNGGAFEDAPTALLSAKLNESSTTVFIDNE